MTIVCPHSTENPRSNERPIWYHADQPMDVPVFLGDMIVKTVFGKHILVFQILFSLE